MRTSDEERRRARELVSGRSPAAAAPPSGWRAIWEGLELAPPAGADAGFGARVAAAVRAERDRPALWAPLPAWARAAAIAALAAGAAGGYWVGAGGAQDEESLLAWGGDTLAEEYVAGDPLDAAGEAP
jgi:hypothetical protein